MLWLCLKIIRVKLNERRVWIWFRLCRNSRNLEQSGQRRPQSFTKTSWKAIQIVTKFIKKKKESKVQIKRNAQRPTTSYVRTDRQSWWTQSPQVLLSSKAAPRAENLDIRVSLKRAVDLQQNLITFWVIFLIMGQLSFCRSTVILNAWLPPK